MALDKLTLAELLRVEAKLKATIERDPGRSTMEVVELEDVQQWIALRRKEQMSAEPTF